MTEFVLNAYEGTLLSWGALAALLLVQLLVADVAGIRARHVPGTPVTGGHDDFLFRAGRAVANSNESIAIYILLALFCVFSGADPRYTGYLSWAYVAARAAYAVCYYLNLQIPRSVCFGISLLVLTGLLVTGLAT